ncbi:hypothetical protein BJ508DRAFT_317665 [Ascobolus immersus RN42]|uniref:DDE Tnp4 domain-containing protein n=1 Tax=Ascobolus immersus RN42 TaxID=1160509 RepID=A0A3N4ICC5_ASCIM|nr:hypothetical protein BJ508DRAFT_317665 [Ascobolus immersus RN42]
MRRSHLRFYLTQAELPPSSHFGTAWIYLFAQGNDKAFITTMGLDAPTFHYLLPYFSKLWNSSSITRGEVRAYSSPTEKQLRRRSLNAAGGLGLALVLHHLCSTMPNYSLHLIFGITPAVCSRYLRFGLALLLKVLRHCPLSKICWPDLDTMRQYAVLIQARHFCLEAAFGFKCVFGSGKCIYNGWCGSHFTSNLLVFAPDGTIFHAFYNAPGNTEFSTSHAELAAKLRTPPKAGFIGYSSDPVLALSEIRFNEELVSARQAAEWGMQCLQGAFSRLKVPMPADDAMYRSLLIEVCVRLHNLRANRIGLNQIRTFYEGIWTDGRVRSTIYHEFRDMLFRDIRKNDRIRRFYNFLP